MSQHLILVDDTDSSIQYSGPWFTAQNTQTNTGNFGPPFQNTLHGVNVDADFSFSFNGSSVTVLGTSITTNASGSQNPTWECFVDNNSIGWNTVLQFAENNWIFCQNDKLLDGPHVLNVKAKVSSPQTFWFDQIQYIPCSNVTLDHPMLHIDSNDTALQYSSGWQPLSAIVNLTQTAGSTLTYEFTGVSLAWVGFTPGHFPLVPSSATYSIDGQSPNNFLVPALSSNDEMERYNQVLFQTGHLSAGNHKLVVTHNGNSSTAPLVLDYFILQDVSLSPSNATNTTSSTTPSSSSSSPASNSTGSTSTTAKAPVGAIIGGVLGGLAMIILLICLLLFIRRRNQRRAQGLSEKASSASSHDIVKPFTLLPSNPQPPPVLFSQNYPSENQSSNSLANNKLRGYPADDPSSSSNMRSVFPSTNTGTSSPSGGGGGGGGTLPTLTASQNQSSSVLPLAVGETNVVDGTMTKGRVPDTVQSTTQRSTSPRDGDARFVRHEDSGLRIPPAEENVVELPPLYTPG